MSNQVTLPKVGEDIESADILEIFVHEGDVVSKGQNVVEVETGKATVVIESTAAGKVSKIHVSKGQTVPVGGPLISVEAADGKAAAQSKPKESPPKEKAPAKKEQPKEAAKPAPKAEVKPPAKSAEKEETSEAEQKGEKEQEVKEAAPKKTPPKSEVADEPTEAPAAESQSSGEIIAAGPAIRRFAREVGVDLSKVSGTGEGGRITREDVLEVVRLASKTMASAAHAPAESAPPSESDDFGPVRYEKLPRIRQTIAAKMHESWSAVPRVTNFDDADVTDLEHLRVSSKDDYARKGIKLTSLPFVIKAVAMALKAHPLLNASVDLENGRVIYKDYVNIGIAVDSERGLVVPSLRGADQLSIPEIARALAILADNVRETKFTLDDLKGSTFTISNLGAIGGTYSTPIVNVPEVAILLVGRSRQLPVVVDGQIAVRLMMPLSLSYDHRLVDGGAAARFLNDVIGYLKAPSRLLLAL